MVYLSKYKSAKSKTKLLEVEKPSYILKLKKITYKYRNFEY